MPVDDLQAMLPPLGVILPSGSSLQGGPLSDNVGIAGPVDKLVITGPIRLAQTKLAGFNLASKMSAISALSGAQTGQDTSIQNLSTDAHVGARWRAHPEHQSRDPCSRNGHRKRRSEEHTSELQSQSNLVCRLLLEKKKY